MTTTAEAPTNIAVLKYWGKNPAWEEYHIPSKSSLSFTVDKLKTKTTVEAKPGGSGRADFTLNGKKIAPAMKEYEYIGDFFAKVGAFHPFVKKYDYRIASENNFPTSAGFASSASGFAALITAMAGELEEFAPLRGDDRRLSALARLGSGSAARSIPAKGGFVVWHRGLEFTDRREPSSLSKAEVAMASESSYAETLFAPAHWPELRLLYAKVEAGEKKVKSRAGMRASIETNPLYGAWVEYEEGSMKGAMAGAMKRRDFPALAALVMKASNNLHQICLGTYPPIVYLNETSLRIIGAVHEMNGDAPKAAYTYDAGPNAVVLTLEKHEREVRSLLEGIVGDNITTARMGEGARAVKGHLF
jgi:diphosphomevalonate decarboxylase